MCAWACSVTKLCLTLFNPMDCSPPGSSAHGISKARILEWVAISFSRGSSDQGIIPESPALAGRFFITEPLGKPLKEMRFLYYWYQLFLVFYNLLGSFYVTLVLNLHIFTSVIIPILQMKQLKFTEFPWDDLQKSIRVTGGRNEMGI